jgi:hypothetical protein
MVANRIPRVLYFHLGSNPTDEQREDAKRFAPNFGFRSADQVSTLAMSPLEECDAVAGEVPKRYADNYPNVSGMDLGQRMLRMSDLDRKHGPVTDIDNEAARAAKPPSVGAEVVSGQGAPRPAGAMTTAGGGWVAPQPGNPDNLQAFGSERAENGVEGANREGAQGMRMNPQSLSDAGVALPRTGTDPDTVTGTVAEGGGQAGFRAPTPADEEAPKTKSKTKTQAAE